MNTELIQKISIHSDTEIKGFFGQYRWMSNFHMCPIFYEGRMYTSSEAAYQSAKTLDDYTRDMFTTLDPSQSKKKGRSFTLRSDWERIKSDVMYNVLLDKFTRNLDLKEKLLATGDKYLEETNYWKDTFYGVCDGEGKNVLGKLLMKIRSELNEQD